MTSIRTDLALEAHALWKESAGETTELPGVIAREEVCCGFPLTRVEILDREGEKALGKPRGVYCTLEVGNLRALGGVSQAAQAVAEILAPLLPGEGTILVCGLGNPDMTPDALGPRTLDYLLVTRHLQKVLPGFRSVAALAAGVLGTTGLEAAEWIRGVAEHVEPAAVVVIDALAARELKRLCSTIQISDTGLIPGSGVGNHRMALNRESLGVPVLSVGVPTVVDAVTVARDILTESGLGERVPESVRDVGPLFVTPDGIDSQLRDLSKILGYGLDLAFQPELELEDLLELLG